jgi:hypothetical protein
MSPNVSEFVSKRPSERGLSWVYGYPGNAARGLDMAQRTLMTRHRARTIF